MKKVKLGMAVLTVALMVPESAEKGGLGLALGAVLTLGLLALAAWLLWRGGALGQKESARACARCSGAQGPRRRDA